MERSISLPGAGRKGLCGFVPCIINYSRRYHGMRAWAQGSQSSFWQLQCPERAEPGTKQPGSAGAQPALHQEVLTAVSQSPENGLSLCLLPLCTNPCWRNCRASTGIPQLVLLAGMPKAQGITLCPSRLCQTPFHQCFSPSGDLLGQPAADPPPQPVGAVPLPQAVPLLGFDTSPTGPGARCPLGPLSPPVSSDI